MGLTSCKAFRAFSVSLVIQKTAAVLNSMTARARLRLSGNWCTWGPGNGNETVEGTQQQVKVITSIGRVSSLVNRWL